MMFELNTDKVNVGCFVNIPSPGLVELVAAAGFDFVILDMEHGAYTWECLENDIRACEVHSVPAIVRVPECRREYILRALDSGASGIQVPMVETKEMAEEVVRLAKYPPIGGRGAAFSHRAAKYGMIGDKPQYVQDANEKTKIIIHIENVPSIENLEGILSVEGLDIIFVGPTDLAVSMGHINDLKHPDVMANIQKVKEQTLAANQNPGILGVNADEMIQFKKEGFKYIVTTLQGILNPEMKKWLDSIKQA